MFQCIQRAGRWHCRAWGVFMRVALQAVLGSGQLHRSTSYHGVTITGDLRTFPGTPMVGADSPAHLQMLQSTNTCSRKLQGSSALRSKGCRQLGIHLPQQCRELSPRELLRHRIITWPSSKPRTPPNTFWLERPKRKLNG